MFNKIILFLILLIIGCMGRGPNVDQKEELILSVIQNLVDEDSVSVHINTSLPNRVYVFQKKDNHFEAKIQVVLTITESDSNKQVLRKTWTQIISEQFYESTRSKTKKFEIKDEHQIQKGNYRIFVKVEDLDSHRIWTSTSDIKQQTSALISDIIAVKKIENEYKPISQRFDLKKDTLYLQFQIFEISPSNSIQIKTSFNIELIDSSHYSLNAIEPFSLHQIPIYPMNISYDYLDFEIKYQKEVRKIHVLLKGVLQKYWSHDINEVVAVMNYILPIEETKIISKLDSNEKEKYIDAYWASKNPIPESAENPILLEFNKRVEYVNEHFSILGDGWRTDRGRIFIKYGPPNSVENKVNDREGYRLQIWNYPNGKQFIFIDRSLFGDYSLYREIY